MPPELTPRQREVMELLVQGKEDQEIAAILGISTKTASNHVTEIFNRLTVSNRTEAVSYWLQRSAEPPPPPAPPVPPDELDDVNEGQGGGSAASGFDEDRLKELFKEAASDIKFQATVMMPPAVNQALLFFMAFISEFGRRSSQRQAAPGYEKIEEMTVKQAEPEVERPRWNPYAPRAWRRSKLRWLLMVALSLLGVIAPIGLGMALWVFVLAHPTPTSPLVLDSSSAILSGQ